MPNHYHLVIEQLSENGISKFLQKVMTGYTMYFNKKYKRSGALFQGKTKSIYIDSDAYYRQLRAYIDLNPVELFNKSWKEKGSVTSVEGTLKFLGDYEWSDCKDHSVYKKYLTGKDAVIFDDMWAD